MENTKVLVFAADPQIAFGAEAREQRQIRFNGKRLTAEQQGRLEDLEQSLGVRLPDRDYWCDPLEL
jgi:hypothetical protein